ncbi:MULTISPECIES: YhbY family RNA-binding protein [unclassified Archaeoglobus]|uniref:YhbY family RNA-binding protein n=1 Tax=unclassified Archaeoglobus TaxID=2643606 RepID=UPI0025C401D7|nr:MULTISPECIES: YhbY family RNA-binding protein [unclassified Archaeoglobus]
MKEKSREKVGKMSTKNVVTINVGKSGVTESLINEINLLLEKRGTVRVKMLRNFRESSGKHKKELAEEIASKVKGRLVDFRGFVLTFER